MATNFLSRKQPRKKTTFTGRDMREFRCPQCGRTAIVDCGKALWEILSEAREEKDKD